MPDDTTAVDRRTLLKATGAAIGVTVIGASSASADHYFGGECVKLKHDYYPYTDCSRENYTTMYERGTRGAVHDECDTHFGPMAHIYPEDTSLSANWVSKDYLEPC